MRHVQRLGSGGRRRTIAGSLALVSGLALFSVARAPLAIGQLASVTVGNSGAGVASTGGNTATGNNSSNAIGGPGATTGGLVDANVGLGSPTNTSTGTATINSGAANASGNESQTGVNQASSGSGSSPAFTPFNPFAPAPAGSNQSAIVSNDGIAAATTGGNSATGNNSDNTIGPADGDGAIDALVALGAPVNTSTGTAAITTGAANATGNTATNGVNQAKITNDGSGGFGSGAGGGAGAPAGFFNATPFFPGTFPGTVNNFGSSFDPCSGRFFPFNPFANASPSGQTANVNNNGDAVASTGNNTAIGNNSTNTQTINQTASGGLIGLNVNLGSPTNNSTGTATINTGAANASGNQSTTEVNQFCGQVPTGGGSGSGSQPMIRNPITGNPIVVSPIATPVVVTPAVQTGTLARTGFESGLALLAAGLVLAGMALLVTARRKLSPVRFAGGVSSSEWDTVVRW